MPLSVLDDSNSSQVVTSSDHAQVTYKAYQHVNAIHEYMLSAIVFQCDYQTDIKQIFLMCNMKVESLLFF